MALYVGARMAEGDVPYRDIQTGATPLGYYLIAFADAIFGVGVYCGRMVLLVADVVALVALCFQVIGAAYLIAHVYRMGRKETLIAGLITFLTFFSSHRAGGLLWLAVMIEILLRRVFYRNLGMEAISWKGYLVRLFWYHLGFLVPAVGYVAYLVGVGTSLGDIDEGTLGWVWFFVKYMIGLPSPLMVMGNLLLKRLVADGRFRIVARCFAAMTILVASYAVAHNVRSAQRWDASPGGLFEGVYMTRKESEELIEVRGFVQKNTSDNAAALFLPFEFHPYVWCERPLRHPAGAFMHRSPYPGVVNAINTQMRERPPEIVWIFAPGIGIKSGEGSHHE